MSAVFGQQPDRTQESPDSGNKHEATTSSRSAPAQRRQRPNLRRQVVVAPAEVLVAPPIELAGVLPVPPKRPAHLPARYEHYRQLGQASSVAPPLPSRPNRYSWAQMQQWQAAAMAAAAARSGNPSAVGAGEPGVAPVPGAAAGPRSPFSSAASRVLVVNPMQIVNLSEHTKSSLVKFIEAVKRFSEKWFSHVLLLMFLAVYACFGAYVFISFEAPTEQWEKQQIIESRQRLVNDSWADATDGKKSKAEFFDSFRSKLEDYERLLNRACASGMTSSSLDNQWNFWGALFYSMTVFTTIGYGHLTPITFAGRVATMVYAIFGIPILLMVLADLGKLLTRIIKYIFKKFRYLFNKLMKRKESLRTRKMISDNTNQYIGVARDAFERGFATYIQPSYDRIPQAFKVGSLKRKRQPDDLEQQQELHQQQSQSVQQADKLANVPPSIQRQKSQSDSAGKKTSETTDVIVTPAKQTKPVSPGAFERQGACSHHQHHNHHHHHHHAHSHHHHQSHNLGRAQSPCAQAAAKRKTSTSGAATLKRNPPVKSSVSRSSSRSSMLGLGDKTKNGNKNAQNSLHQQDSLKNTSDGQSADIDLPVKETGNNVGGLADTDAGEKQAGCRICSHNDLEQTDQLGHETDHSVGESDESSNRLNEEDELEDDLDIPVSFALFLLVTYMMFGAVVFSIWEGWNFFDSLYFVFISMSTIGFGDLVPQHPKRMIGTFAYLLFGLALTSMCINVVQEKIHATFLRAKMQIGEKMGFDLDQIMADDYYDGSVGECDPDGYDEDCCSQANSSTAGAHHQCAAHPSQHQHHQQHHHQHHHHQEGQECDAAQCDECRAEETGGILRLSKSRESLRGYRRRPAASLPSHGNTSSLRRRPSKRMSSTAGGSAAHQEPAPPRSPSLGPSQQAPGGSQRSVEKATTPTATVEPPTPTPEDKDQYPLSAEVICGPASTLGTTQPTSTKQAAQQLSYTLGARPKLVATRSQPTPCSVSKSISSDLAKLTQANHPVDANSASSTPPSSSSKLADTQRRQSSGNGRLALSRSGRRSEGSSRRSSVSQELNELDDLIVALSHSPSERFGPLLGIPSSGRSSRSTSPSNLTSMNRRGTSMTTPKRAQMAPGAAAASSISAGTSQKHRKKLSLGNQPLSGGSGSSNPGAGTSGKTKFTVDPISAESQAALEELEAIKFSAV